MSHTLECHVRRFGLRGVRSTLATNASNKTDSRGDACIGFVIRRWIERDAPGQVVEAEVEPRAPLERLAQTRDRSFAASSTIERDEDDFRHVEAQRTGKLSANELGDQRLFPWPAPRSFTTYRPESSLHEGGTEPPSRKGRTYLVASTVRSMRGEGYDVSDAGARTRTARTRP